MATFRCDECRALSIADSQIDDDPNWNQSHISLMMEQGSLPIEWIPAQATGRMYRDVPQHIADAAHEAHKCRSVGAHRAAVLLARSVIEATAKERGVVNGTLAAKIDELHNRGLVREIVREQAHEVRFLGNEMAHGDFVEPISSEEADEILELMAEVLNEVYQAPAKLEARRQARIARQQSDSGSGV